MANVNVDGRRRTLPSMRSSWREKSKLLTVGDLAPDFELADHNGTKVKLSSFRGKRVLLSFFRFAASPICVYNVDRLKQHSDMFKKAGVVTLCIFKSTPQNIVNYSPASSSEDAIALSDTNGSVFKTFMVKKSTRATMNGTVDLLKSFRKCKQVINVSADTNQIRQLPADFMINEDGVIVDLYRAKRMGDHMTFERVEAFIPEEKRCRCSKRDCIVPRCRETYEEIKRQSERMIHMGY